MEKTFEIQEIMRYLPHRYPFILVDQPRVAFAKVVQLFHRAVMGPIVELSPIDR